MKKNKLIFVLVFVFFSYQYAFANLPPLPEKLNYGLVKYQIKDKKSGKIGTYTQTEIKKLGKNKFEVWVKAQNSDKTTFKIKTLFEQTDHLISKESSLEFRGPQNQLGAIFQVKFLDKEVKVTDSRDSKKLWKKKVGEPLYLSENLGLGLIGNPVLKDVQATTLVVGTGIFKVRVKNLGEETVTVPGGTFDCYKLKIIPDLGLLDKPLGRAMPGIFVWQDKKFPHLPVKYEGPMDVPTRPAVLAEMIGVEYK